jgi:hypothetical protein
MSTNDQKAALLAKAKMEDARAVLVDADIDAKPLETLDECLYFMEALSEFKSLKKHLPEPNALLDFEWPKGFSIGRSKSGVNYLVSAGGRFDEDLNAIMKKMGGRWDGVSGSNTKQWIVPDAPKKIDKHLDALRDWTAAKTAESERLNALQIKSGVYAGMSIERRASVATKEFIGYRVQVPDNESAKEKFFKVVRDHGGESWDAKTKTYLFPPSRIEGLLSLIEKVKGWTGADETPTVTTEQQPIVTAPMPTPPTSQVKTAQDFAPKRMPVPDEKAFTFLSLLGKEIIVSVKDGQVFIENKATGLGALEVTRIERVEKAGEPYSIIFKMPVSVQKNGLGKAQVAPTMEIHSQFSEIERLKKAGSEAASNNRKADLEDRVPGYHMLSKAIYEAEAYREAFTRAMENEQNDGARMPKSSNLSVSEIAKQYPVAALYIRAEGYFEASNSQKSAAGALAMNLLTKNPPDVAGAENALENWLPKGTNQWLD